MQKNPEALKWNLSLESCILINFNYNLNAYQNSLKYDTHFTQTISTVFVLASW